jgi:hypothetical protein
MPAEPTLTTAREASGPSLRADRGAFGRPSAARLDQIAAALAPIGLIGGLALAGGGFDVTNRHIAGLAVWLVVIGLLVLGAASNATVGRPLYWTAGLLGSFALLSAISSLWSGSAELSVIEADRVLVYLGFFIAAFLIAQTDERRQRFAEGLAIAVTLVAFLGLGSRLLPHVLNVSESLGSGPRLLYPLGYWNANGALCGISIALLLWMSREAGLKALRWLAVGAMPAVLLTLYFTYSRGGLLALVVAAGCLIVLSRDRLWLLATLSIGLLGALPAVLAVQARRSLADNLATQTSVDQGVTVLLILLGGIALSLLLFAGLKRLERGDGQRTGRALALSRNPKVLRGIALAAAVLAIGAAVAVGGRAWHQFSSGDIEFPSNPAQHFGQLSGAGRHDFWDVAIESFEEKPVAGHGAGTYVFLWNRHRSIYAAVHDAHSLYLESFAELGTIGGLLVLALVGAFLACGFGAWRAAPANRRDTYAALFAAMLAFAVGAAFDWFWEIAAAGSVFFLAGGVLVSARCAQLALDSGRERTRKGRSHYGLAMAGLGVAWLAAIALVGPLLVEREISSSQDAVAASKVAGEAGEVGQAASLLESAVEHADTARSIEPWAASPYLQLGLIAQRQGDYPTAAMRLSQAIEREDHRWQLYYLRAQIEEEGGEPEAAAADLRQAEVLNPKLSTGTGEE